MDKLYMVIPAYNEEENIKDVVDSWYKIMNECNVCSESKILVIDDGSKDNTYKILATYAEINSYVIPITKDNSGHGSTLLFGYQYAIDSGADYIFQTDSDGQTVPSEFKEFWDNRCSYDMLIGNRKKREDGISRKFVTTVLRLVVHIIFGEDIVDVNTPFRLMKTDSLKLIMKYIPPNYNLSNVIITIIYNKYYKIKFIPITFKTRQGGVNSINIKNIAKIGIKAIKEFKQINRAICSLNSEAEIVNVDSRNYKKNKSL